MRKLLVAFALLLSVTAHAQPIKIVVPYPVGGGTDILTRYFEAKLKDKVYVENKGGASGMIGTDLVVRAKPDGKTLLMGHVTPNGIDPAHFMTPQSNSNRDLEPIVLVATARALLVTNKEFPVNTLEEFKAYAKKNVVIYASDGIGSVADLKMARTLKGYETIHSPYKGGAPALQSLLTKETQILYSPEPVAMSWIKGDKIKVIPTPSEDDLWWGLFAPRGTDPKVLDHWHKEFTAILNEPSTKEWMASQGYNIRLISRDQFATFVKREQDKYRRFDGKNP